MISVKNITKKFGDQYALKNISFDINKGEIVGLLGPNGAGKSTLMKIINSSINYDSGEVTIDDLNTGTEEIKVKSIIGYLPENNPLYSNMYIREYLSYIADIYNVDKIKINIVIEKTNLTAEAHKKIAQLSKGYKQRVGLAAAILHNPKYLILDEPTTGLDPKQIIEIRNLIKEFGKQKTVLLSTHIMQEVQAMCDRVIIINKGEIVKDELLSNFSKENKNLYKIKFSGAIENLDELDATRIIEKVDSITYIIDNSDENLLLNLATFAKNNSVRIVEFHEVENNLEDIFIELTK